MSAQFTVPGGYGAGDTVQLSVNGATVTITLPPGAVEGTVLEFALPPPPPPPPPLVATHDTMPAAWRDDGADTSSSESDAEADEEEQVTYTSGEEDATGPAILSPSAWRARHVRRRAPPIDGVAPASPTPPQPAGRCSKFRKAVRPLRVQ